MMIKRTINSFLDNPRQRFLYSLLFAALFSIIGWGVPRFYDRFLDHTVYYDLKAPILLDRKAYKACDMQLATSTRNAKINLEIRFVRGLYRLTKDETGNELGPGALKYSIERMAVVEASKDKTVVAIYQLPCDTTPGIYYWKVAALYKVNGIERTDIFVSENFNVTPEGSTLPTIQESIEPATKGGELK